MNHDIEDQLPDPELVARAAAQEPAPRLLEDYMEAISILRDKQFTFREIAEWLKEKFGIQADHNSVWRAYTKHMNEFEAHQEAQADEELERDEAIAYSDANGLTKVIVPNATPAAAATIDANTAAKAPKTAAKRSKKGK